MFWVPGLSKNNNVEQSKLFFFVPMITVLFCLLLRLRYSFTCENLCPVISSIYKHSYPNSRKQLFRSLSKVRSYSAQPSKTVKLLHTTIIPTVIIV